MGSEHVLRIDLDFCCFGSEHVLRTGPDFCVAVSLQFDKLLGSYSEISHLVKILTEANSAKQLVLAKGLDPRKQIIVRTPSSSLQVAESNKSAIQSQTKCI